MDLYLLSPCFSSLLFFLTPHIHTSLLPLPAGSSSTARAKVQTWAKVNQGHPNPCCISNHGVVIFFNNLLQIWQPRHNYLNEVCRHWIMSWNKWWKLLTVIKSTGDLIFKCVVKKEKLLYVCFVGAKLFALILIKQACVMTRIYFPSW